MSGYNDILNAKHGFKMKKHTPHLRVGLCMRLKKGNIAIVKLTGIFTSISLLSITGIQHKKEKEEKERLAAISVANAFMIPGMRAS